MSSVPRLRHCRPEPASLVFAAGTQIADLSTLRVDATVQFRDANGNNGSASTSFAGFGAWDY
jgi:hypothetical protein